uniref:Uncharacterized protein n=1 Tax=Chelonoidis abingdonii TaxID=106734 RepID=A0A8C0J480_CHEAB
MPTHFLTILARIETKCSGGGWCSLIIFRQCGLNPWRELHHVSTYHFNLLFIITVLYSCSVFCSGCPLATAF